MDRFAAISDIHGNSLALTTVLEDIRRRGIASIVNLGDHLQGPLDPLGTAEMLIPLRLPSIRGNCDRLLYETGTVAAEGSTVAANWRAIREDHRQWLAQMPQTLIFDGDVLLCHGTPWADDVYLLEEIGASSVRLCSRDDLARDLAGVAAKLILCGYSHVPAAAMLPDGRLVANPGSVGLPAYTDELPRPHAMEAGTPHARYAVFLRESSGWEFEHVAVAYDWEAAARFAERNGRPDWAKWLRTGRG